jgi:hypothetical protein
MFTVPGLVLGAVGAWSCSAANALPGPLGDLAAQCGLVCAANGVAEGNASISGVANVDAFFGSVVHFQAAADGVSDGIQAELDAIAVSLGAKTGDGGVDLKAKLDVKLKANVQGGLKISYEPPKCSVSAKATLTAQAKCDASVDPGSASVKCEGSCTADASAKVDCGADATLSCTGTAPGLTCSGSCKGDCELSASAKCDGTCSGTCTGTCSVKDASGNCEGTCEGTCKGTCKLAVAATCGGSCKGECTVQQPSGQCSGGAQAHCDAKASAKVDCKGTCSGNVTPPKAKAECEASAKADASVSAECKPPTLAVTFQLSATAAADAKASAEFTAWLEGFKGHVAAILAYKAKLSGLATAGADIAANAEAAIKTSINGTLSGKVDLKATVGLGCALTELPKAVGMVTAAGTKLQASGKAAVDVLGSVGVT